MEHIRVVLSDGQRGIVGISFEHLVPALLETILEFLIYITNYTSFPFKPTLLEFFPFAAESIYLTN